MAPTTDPTTRPAHRLPPPAPPSTSGPSWPTAPGAARRPDVVGHATPAARVAWKERVPELVGGIGVTMVLVAVAGFLASSWSQVTDVQKAFALGLAALGVTVAATWADRREDVSGHLRRVVALVLSGGTVLTGAALTLGVASTYPGHGRVAMLVGGLAALVHAAWVWDDRRDSLLAQVVLFAAAVYPVGPAGLAVGSEYGTALDWSVLDPVVGLFDPTFTSTAFVVTALGHLVVAVGFLGVHHATDGRAQRLGALLAALAATSAAMQANLHPSALGAVFALAVVVGVLAYGLVAEEGWLVLAGSLGLLVAGVRVLTAVFSGKVLVIVALLVTGLGLLAWALHAAQARPSVPS